LIHSMGIRSGRDTKKTPRYEKKKKGMKRLKKKGILGGKSAMEWSLGIKGRKKASACTDGAQQKGKSDGSKGRGGTSDIRENATNVLGAGAKKRARKQEMRENNCSF